jgi:hypothetical protein
MPNNNQNFEPEDDRGNEFHRKRDLILSKFRYYAIRGDEQGFLEDCVSGDLGIPRHDPKFEIARSRFWNLVREMEAGK